jgi:hypothetical protein
MEGLTMTTTKATHTPGPWTWHADRDGGAIVDGRGRAVARVNDFVFECGDNARLIAAAPEMLAALKAFVAAYEHIGHGCWPADTKNPQNVLDPARALLAKIEGA